jgi:hypothetical protein
MTLRDFVNNFAELVKQANVNNALKLAKGQVANMEEYHRQVGRNEGLDSAVTLLREMLGQIENQQEGDLPEMPKDSGE